MMDIVAERTEGEVYNIAEAKRRFSEIVSRVAYGGATIVITRRGRPMAKLVPPEAPERERHLGEIQGWLEADDPFFSAIDAIVEERSRHRPRAVSGAAPRRTKR